MFQDTDTK